jgi:hypothetical protein
MNNEVEANKSLNRDGDKSKELEVIAKKGKRAKVKCTRLEGMK